ncbi:SSI family serine proteinase inhibitor [Streptomyces sp. 891-h]|uniref:SSI family serine proteinase inhibitor n=1 Tax=Streptomyces sp. 891-h TaxID=2720714 RepID=UPI001FA99717|nr:SSI family serine proteinase inhibitor [Streptomyces sp. 891-h]
MSTRISTRHLVRTALAAAALALPLLAPQPAPAADAASAPRSAKPDRGDQGVFLTVSRSGKSTIRGVLLQCEPSPRGKHPKAAQACAALDKTRGNLNALPGKRGHCTMKHDPVTAEARGSHRGKAVNWKKTFPNACAMHRATGPLFDF